MTGVGAQGDPCTATIFWSVVRSHLLYSANSPISVRIQWLTSLNLIIVAWLHKNFHLSDEIWIQLKTFNIFPCRFLVAHISPIRTGELNSHHQQSPMRVEGVHTAGRFPVPRRDLYDTAVTTSVPCILRHDASHLAFGGPEPCLPS
jgi:hypothetical protein